jgi:hypothetical protein
MFGHKIGHNKVGDHVRCKYWKAARADDDVHAGTTRHALVGYLFVLVYYYARTEVLLRAKRNMPPAAARGGRAAKGQQKKGATGTCVWLVNCAAS